jgi:transaldolase
MNIKATEQLHQTGQSLWLDNITRGLLTSGMLERYIRDLSITGLTSNPSIFDHAIRKTGFYDDAIRGKPQPGEKLLFKLALAEHGQVSNLLFADGGDCEVIPGRFSSAGIEPGKLAEQLRREGAEAFVESWTDLMQCIESKSLTVRTGAGA